MRVYTVSAAGLTIAGATTLLFINPNASAGIEIRKITVGQSQNATAALQRVQLVTQVTAFPTLAAGVTPRAHRISDPISVITSGTTGAAGLVGVNATAEGGGAKTVRVDDVFNVTLGWLWQPLDRDEYISLPPSGTSGFGIYFPVAPANLANWCVALDYAELA